jgi:hypothetical protein
MGRGQADHGVGGSVPPRAGYRDGADAPSTAGSVRWFRLTRHRVYHRLAIPGLRLTARAAAHGHCWTKPEPFQTAVEVSTRCGALPEGRGPGWTGPGCLLLADKLGTGSVPLRWSRKPAPPSKP